MVIAGEQSGLVAEVEVVAALEERLEQVASVVEPESAERQELERELDLSSELGAFGKPLGRAEESPVLVGTPVQAYSDDSAFHCNHCDAGQSHWAVRKYHFGCTNGIQTSWPQSPESKGPFSYHEHFHWPLAPLDSGSN